MEDNNKAEGYRKKRSQGINFIYPLNPVKPQLLEPDPMEYERKKIGKDLGYRKLKSGE